MKKLITLLASLCFAVPAFADIVMGPVTNASNGHIYYLLSGNTWSNSEAEAVSMGGHLVTINNADENQWVLDTFAYDGGIVRPLWIGFTDRDTEGTFTWMNGETSTYSNWATGEPNNAVGWGNYEEDFAYIREDTAGFWNDIPDTGYSGNPQVFGVVEIVPVITSPEPFIHDGLLCWQTHPTVVYQAQWRNPKSQGRSLGRSSARSLAKSEPEWHNFGSPVVGTGDEVCVSGKPKADPKREYRVLVLYFE